MSTSTASRADLKAPLAVAAVGAGLFALLYARDPHDSGSYGYCPYLAVTGLPCPGCGGLRAVNDLTHGNIVSAISSNALAVALVATLIVAWVLWVARRVRTGVNGPMIALSPRVSWIMLGVVLVFGLVRVLPFGSWLAP